MEPKDRRTRPNRATERLVHDGLILAEKDGRPSAPAEYAWRSLADISTVHIAQHITETTTVSGAVGNELTVATIRCISNGGDTGLNPVWNQPGEGDVHPITRRKARKALA